MVTVHTETLPRHIKELVVLSELYKHILYGGEAVRVRRKHEWDDSGFGMTSRVICFRFYCRYIKVMQLHEAIEQMMQFFDRSSWSTNCSMLHFLEHRIGLVLVVFYLYKP